VTAPQQYYPDVTAAGGLNAALAVALTEIGSALTATGLPPQVRFVAYGRVEQGNRFLQVYLAANQRLFMFDFWRDGVAFATAETPEITDVAKAIDQWVGARCSLDELAAIEFVTVNDHAIIYEQGREADAVDELLAVDWEEFPSSGSVRASSGKNAAVTPVVSLHQPRSVLLQPLYRLSLLSRHSLRACVVRRHLQRLFARATVDWQRGCRAGCGNRPRQPAPELRRSHTRYSRRFVDVADHGWRSAQTKPRLPPPRISATMTACRSLAAPFPPF
jgi:hypothetical protein